VLAQLIGHFYNGNLEQAVRDALHEVQGTYGIAVVSADEPDRIVAARKGSPLIIGIGDGEYIVASDAAAIIAHTHQVIYLSDGEMATVSRDGFRTMTLEAVPVTKEVTEVEFSLDQIELGGHEHFMAKEIFEQPISLANTLRGRLDARQGIVTLGASPICLATWPGPAVSSSPPRARPGTPACWASTSSRTSPRSRPKPSTPASFATATADRGRHRDHRHQPVGRNRRHAGRPSRGQGERRAGPGRGQRGGQHDCPRVRRRVYLHCGPEIGVASTKAFTSQVAVLTMMAIRLGRRRYLSHEDCCELTRALAAVPEHMGRVLEQSDAIRAAVERHVDRENWLFLGRGYNYPVALEGALKLKEISYIHAEGMPAAEMKHGPIALISKACRWCSSPRKAASTRRC